MGQVDSQNRIGKKRWHDTNPGSHVHGSSPVSKASIFGEGLERPEIGEQDSLHRPARRHLNRMPELQVGIGLRAVAIEIVGQPSYAGDTPDEETVIRVA